MNLKNDYATATATATNNKSNEDNIKQINR